MLSWIWRIKTVSVPANSSAVVTLSGTPNGKLKLWSPDTPNLYGLQVWVKQDERVVDRKYTRFGWREFSIKGSTFLLNGKRFEMRGRFMALFGSAGMTTALRLGLV